MPVVFLVSDTSCGSNGFFPVTNFTSKPKYLGTLFDVCYGFVALYPRPNPKFLSEKVMLCEIHSRWMLCSLVFLLHLDNTRCLGFRSIVLDLDSLGKPTIFVKIFLYSDNVVNIPSNYNHFCS